ncbi:hypothetical protein MMPV_006103 [Pyropia vietnamensis]
MEQALNLRAVPRANPVALETTRPTVRPSQPPPCPPPPPSPVERASPPRRFPADILTLLPPSTSPCGYCGHPRPSFRSNGFLAHRLTPATYNALLDAGYRRSGTFVYKSANGVTCCQHLVIRLEAARFAPSRSQRKRQAKLRRLLAAGEVDGEEVAAECNHSPGGVAYACNVAFVVAAAVRRRTSSLAPAPLLPESGCEPGGPSPAGQPTKAAYLAAKAAASAAATKLQMTTAAAVAPTLRAVPGVLHVEVVAPGFVNVWVPAAVTGAGWDTQKEVASADGMDTSAGEGGMSTLVESGERRNASSSPSGADNPAASDATAPPIGAIDTQRLLTRLGFPSTSGRCITSNGWSTAYMQEGGDLSVGANGSASASGGGGSSSTDSEKVPAGAAASTYEGGGGDVPGGGLRVTLAPAAFHEDEFELYKAYQAAIHDKSPTTYTPAGYSNFLVETPLPPPSESWSGSSSTGNDSSDSSEDPPTPAPPCGYGTFHARYELNGALIAVAVLDILPRCVSSVYLFYAPAYGHLSLGSLSALHEIAHTASLTSTCPDLRYYYMGYYIHRCPKMVYKGTYAPSELLCEATQMWVPLPEAVGRLHPGGRAPVEVRPSADAVADANSNARVSAGTDDSCDRYRDSDHDIGVDNSDDDSDGEPPAGRRGGGNGRSDGHGDATAVVRLAPPSVPAVPTPVLDEATLDDIEVILCVRGGCVRLRLSEVEAWMVTSSSSMGWGVSNRHRRRRGGGGTSNDSGSGGGSGGDGDRDVVGAVVRVAVADLRRRVATFVATAGVAVAASAAYVLEVDL